MYNRLLELREDIGSMTKEVECLAKAHPICSKLMALEGVGPISAFWTCFRAQQSFSASSRPRPRQDASFGVGGSCYFMTLLPPYPIGTECRRSTFGGG